jgi:cell shape-determining protein MreC
MLPPGFSRQQTKRRPSMMRRLSLALLFVIFFAGSAWPKWDVKDRQYLEERFRELQEEIQALKTQLGTLSGQLAELRQNQAQLQAVIIRQQRTLQEMDQLVSSIRLSQEENFAGLKTSLSQVRSQNEKSFAKLIGMPPESAAGTSAAGQGAALPARAAPPRVVEGYITVVQGNKVTVDLGSAQGIQPGSRLAVYKANDPSVRVGVVEVEQVVDAGNSQARIVTMNPGVQPEFSDIVRLE